MQLGINCATIEMHLPGEFLLHCLHC